MLIYIIKYKETCNWVFALICRMFVLLATECLHKKPGIVSAAMLLWQIANHSKYRDRIMDIVSKKSQHIWDKWRALQLLIPFVTLRNIPCWTVMSLLRSWGLVLPSCHIYSWSQKHSETPVLVKTTRLVLLAKKITLSPVEADDTNRLNKLIMKAGSIIGCKLDLLSTTAGGHRTNLYG